MDYAYRVRKPDPDDPDFEDSFVMFFELIGQPYLNQRAREVAPFRTSLSSASVYLIVSKMRIIFWIGNDFYDCYLDEETFNRQDCLIGEDLLDKVIMQYEIVQNGVDLTDDLLLKTARKKVYFTIEGLDQDFR